MKILIAIESCQAHTDRHDVIRRTWLEGSVPEPTAFDLGTWEYRFFVGGPLLFPKHKWDEVWVDAPDDYEGLPLKTMAICDWARRHEYTHLFKCDTDTYVHVDRLLASGFQAHDYAGFFRDPFDSHLQSCKGSYASGGPGYWLSNRAMAIIASGKFTVDYLHHEKWRGYWNGEDKQVGRRLNEFGIECHWDPRYRMDHMYPLAVNNYITAHPVVTRLVGNRMLAAHELVKGSGI